MEKIITTAEETRKYFVMLGTVLIGTTPISTLADTGPMDWFYFRELAEFAEFIDGHGIRYGEKSKVEGGTLALAMMGGEVAGYISIPLQVSNNYRYMVAIKAAAIRAAIALVGGHTPHPVLCRRVTMAEFEAVAPDRKD